MIEAKTDREIILDNSSDIFTGDPSIGGRYAEGLIFELISTHGDGFTIDGAIAAVDMCITKMARVRKKLEKAKEGE